MLQALHSQLQYTIKGAHGKRRGKQITERLLMHGCTACRFNSTATSCTRVASAALIRFIRPSSKDFVQWLAVFPQVHTWSQALVFALTRQADLGHLHALDGADAHVRASGSVCGVVGTARTAVRRCSTAQSPVPTAWH